ncbi:hypothetical protein CRG98_041070 [Punica granatum]|uniref:Uncharacterized protein n=1 Tax=Punica granatum TaxID=22663 RepID=A0A2I0I3G6_PUNGR|nr:hypothetical protein CRG98_041070 [Punica granatum]
MDARRYVGDVSRGRLSHSKSSLLFVVSLSQGQEDSLLCPPFGSKPRSVAQANRVFVKKEMPLGIHNHTCARRQGKLQRMSVALNRREGGGRVPIGEWLFWNGQPVEYVRKGKMRDLMGSSKSRIR